MFSFQVVAEFVDEVLQRGHADRARAVVFVGADDD